MIGNADIFNVYNMKTARQNRYRAELILDNVKICLQVD